MKYYAFLRAINVGGNRIIKMKDLSALFSDLKFKNVKTFIQSGNVMFESSEKDVKKLEKKIEDAVLKTFGFNVDTVIRTESEMTSLMKDNPFRDTEISKLLKVYIVFLKDELNSEQKKLLDTFSSESETYRYLKKEVVVLYNKEGRGLKFSNNFIERKLKVVGTTRDLNMLRKLIV